MHSKSIRWVSLTLSVVMALLVLLPTVLAKTELLSNGDFVTDVSDWEPFGSTTGGITHNSSEGHTAIGAATVQNKSSSTSSTTNGARQGSDDTRVISVDPNQYYTVEGWIKIPSSGNNFNHAFVRVAWYPVGSYSSQISTVDTNLITATDTWQRVSRTAQSPGDAGRAQIRLYINKTGSDTGTAYFDDLSFFPSTANAVTLNSLAVAPKSLRHGPTLVWSAATLIATVALTLGGLLLARRRRLV